MKRTWIQRAVFSLMLPAGFIGAQPETDLTVLQAQATERVGKVGNAYLADYLDGLRNEAQAASLDPATLPQKRQLRVKFENIIRLAGDMDELPRDSAWRQAPFACYVVPAISPIKRLPDTLPPDGDVTGLIRLVGAKGEYIPASFVIAPMTDVQGLRIQAEDLTGEAGRLPSENIDVKVVKTWYQPGTAWYTYFADPTRRALVPALLLNDENLIRVDMENQQNYLRVDYPEGSRYVWISYPGELDGERQTSDFNHRLEPVADSPTLLPVRLDAGQSKQIWITVKVPEQAAAGIYEGRLILTPDNGAALQLPLRVRVLPFSLPEPRTYHDLDRQFYSFVYHRGSLANHLENNNNDMELAEHRLRVELENMRRHNVANHYQSGIHHFDAQSVRILTRNLEIAGEAGFRPPLIVSLTHNVRTTSPQAVNPDNFERHRSHVAEMTDLVHHVLGHRDIYYFGACEAPRSSISGEHDIRRALHEMGVKTYNTARDWHYALAGYGQNMANYGGNEWQTREYSVKWHMIGQKVASYAGPHFGPMNPDFSRRVHGMRLYKAMFDGTGNHAWYDDAGTRRHPWNEFANPFGYRIRTVYPTKRGIIDTLAWEGYREALDDVRYATKLKMLAAAAMESATVDVVYAGRQAVMWLELLDENSADLNDMRMEMIHYILGLLSLLEG